MNFIFDKRVIGEKRAALALFSMVLLLVIFNPFGKTTESMFLSSLLILVSTIPFFIWRRKKNRDVVVMGVFFYGFFHLVGYGFSGFISHETGILIMQNFSNSFNRYQVSEGAENTAKMLVILHLLIVFSGFVILQFFFKNPKAEEDRKKKPKESITTYRSVVVLCIFFTAVEFFRVAGIPPFSVLGDGITFAIVSFFTYMYLFYFVFYLNYGGWVTKILAILGCLIIRGSLLSWSQMGPYAEVGLILILISIQKGRIPVSQVALLFMAFIIYQPMKGAIRSMQDYGGFEFAESVETGLEVIRDDTYITLIDIATKRIDYNLLLASMVDNIGVANEDDYIGWKGYENVSYVLIPRIFWRDKPQDNFGNEWAVQAGWLGRDDRFTSYNLPWLPQMYLSFGVIGIIIGSFLVAIGLFLLERYYWTITPDAWTFAMAYSIIRAIIHLESDFVLAFGVAIKVILIDICIRIIKNLLTERKKNKGKFQLPAYGLEKIS